FSRDWSSDVCSSDLCALLAGGGYSRHALAHQDLCLPVPPGIGLAEAAALPETAFTVWFNLVQQGGLRAGDRVLIHGGASGIGTLDRKSVVPGRGCAQ